MASISATVIFDIGKTNKKCIVFGPDYNILSEETVSIPPIRDEDGYPAEDIESVVRWVRERLVDKQRSRAFEVNAVNFSAYGATLVHVDERGERVTPVYDYMRATDLTVADSFYELFGGREAFSLQTGSPALALLNSGYQLYWLQHAKPEQFRKIKASLHLPQYFTWLFTGHAFSEITSIGCHTGLWDFRGNHYHRWVEEQQCAPVLPLPSHPGKCVVKNGIRFGVGIHDSTAALIPLCTHRANRFGVLSTGTWNIFLLPGYAGELTAEMYRQDCLYYLLAADVRVAASRLHLGRLYEDAMQLVQKAFANTEDAPANTGADTEDFVFFKANTVCVTGQDIRLKFETEKTALDALLCECVTMQVAAIRLLTNEQPLDRIYVSGGFAANAEFLALLREMMPETKFEVTEIANASALGAAQIVNGWEYAAPAK